MDINSLTYDINDRTCLCNLMVVNKSDKGYVYNGKHNYTCLYNELFKNIKYEKLNVFELIQNKKIITMNSGFNSKYSSLFAWCIFFPNSIIHTANIGNYENIIGNNRIKTYNINNTNNLWNQIPEMFDIIINDANLTIELNFQFLDQSLDKLKSGGVFIIEDIPIVDIEIYETKLRTYNNIFYRIEIIPNNDNNIDNCLILIQKFKNIKKIFITFGNEHFYDAKDRICKQVEQCKLFDKIIGYTDNDLKNDEYFWKSHGTFITNNTKGYGYWIWKPYLILKTLKTLKDGDVVLYLDSGCEIDYRYSKKINEILNTNKLLLASPSFYDNITYIKQDLVKYIDIYNTDNILKNMQLQCGSLVIVKSNITIKFFEEFYNTCHLNNYHFLDDSPSIEQEHSNFIQHCHDQAIFNLLAIKYNLVDSSLIPKICLYLSCDNNYPIKYWRNKTGISKLK